MSETQTRYTAVGLGEALWDLLPEGKQLGGAPANFAYHARMLGADGVIVSRVGDDDLGREILARLAAVNLGGRYIGVDGEHPTGTVSVELDSHGQPDYVIHEGVAWDFIATTPDLTALAATADAVCFGSLCQRSPVSRETIRQFLAATRPECLRIFDINLRQAYYSREIVADMLDVSDVLKLNDDELGVVAEMLSITGDEDDIARRLVDRYSLHLVALTRGRAGSSLYAPGQTARQEGLAVDVADTVGAGDSFTAAVAMGLLRGHDLDRIGEHASRLAGYVCSCNGAMPAIPNELLDNKDD